MNGELDRREFCARVIAFAGGAAVLQILDFDRVMAEVIAKDDPRLETGYVTYKGETGEIRAYTARPKGAEKLPGVIVIHENRGLNAHIEDMARRVALQGYSVIAPDALSPLGGSPSNPEEAPALIQKLDREANTKNFIAAAAYLKTQPQATGKVAATGFCWGGGVTNQLAVSMPDLNVAVPFYGIQPAPEDVPKIKASMLIHYAGTDERINAGIAAFEEALKKAGVDYKIYMYEGAQHAFMNDTSTRYQKEAADLAWQRTIAFFKEKLTT